MNLKDDVLRSLSVSGLIRPDNRGRPAIVANPDPKPYRFTDPSDDAPTGFGFYVGNTGTTYEVSKRIGGKLVRVSLGSVRDMGLQAAYEEARRQIAHINKFGESAKRHDNNEAQTSALKSLTISGAMTMHAEHMMQLVHNNKLSESSLRSVRNSLSRLSRPEVHIAHIELRDLNTKTLTNAWNALRTSAMLKSNRVNETIKGKLALIPRWWDLPIQKYQELGVEGKYIQRTRAAGVEATEHTFADLYRAVEYVIRKERGNAMREGREPAIMFNPISVLRDDQMYRTEKEKRDHHRKAQTRNPLGHEDDSLPMVMKTLLFRRNMQNGLNATGVDYLMLTLLWGTRRNEAVKLEWYEDLSKDELMHETSSWVWLANDPNDINPTTKRRGSQVFFHDTKSKDVRFLPVTYFAERILRMRYAERKDGEKQYPRDLIYARNKLDDARKETTDKRKLKLAEDKVRTVQARIERLKWVFPARSLRAKHGYYTDSKSILKNVRIDSGLLDLRKDIDIGLTPHDLRRTLGRYAEKQFGGKRIVSDMLNHKVRSEVAGVTNLYNEQEWAELIDAFATVEETMVASSPRVWNALKGSDKARLDEVNDPMPVISANLRKKEQ